MKEYITKEELNERLAKQRKQFGITLVALTITMIVMLIMAGILIVQLSGNGLMERTKLSKEKYEEAEDLQNSTITGYQNEIESVGSSRDVYEANPIGTIISIMAKDEDGKRPNGYLVCNGATYPVEGEYKNLAEYIKTQFGSYDYFKIGTETVETGKFKVPDLRGEFLRGSGTNPRGVGSGSDVGAHQDPTKNIYLNYPYNTASANHDALFGSVRHTWNYDKDTNGGTTYQYYAARPTNTSVLYCIKY